MVCCLNEKVGFKRHTTCYQNAVRYTVVLHSGLPVWGGASGLGVARGIQGKGPDLTFDPLRLLSDLKTKQKKIPSRTNSQPEYIYFSFVSDI